MSQYYPPQLWSDEELAARRRPDLGQRLVAWARQARHHAQLWAGAWEYKRDVGVSMNKLFHKRLPDWEQYDEIRLAVVPRYKTSGLSGDEWRQSVFIDLMFKGKIIKQHRVRDMQTAILLLGRFYVDDNGLSDEHLTLDDQYCDQPSCRNKAVARLSLKRLTAPNGEWLDMADQYGTYYRKFCLRHIQRGDCDREDADDNYTPMDEKSAKDSTFRNFEPREDTSHS